MKCPVANAKTNVSSLKREWEFETAAGRYSKKLPRFCHILTPTSFRTRKRDIQPLFDKAAIIIPHSPSGISDRKYIFVPCYKLQFNHSCTNTYTGSLSKFQTSSNLQLKGKRNLPWNIGQLPAETHKRPTTFISTLTQMALRLTCQCIQGNFTVISNVLT